MTPLEARLRHEGISGRIEMIDKVAVIVPDESAVPLTRERRRRAVQIAREEGFSHVSVELDPAGATVSRD